MNEILLPAKYLARVLPLFLRIKKSEDCAKQDEAVNNSSGNIIFMQQNKKTKRA